MSVLKNIIGIIQNKKSFTGVLFDAVTSLMLKFQNTN
jgi:hypothetical protein